MNARLQAIARAKYLREARIRGTGLTLGYAGPWTRDPSTGAVSRAALPPVATLGSL